MCQFQLQIMYLEKHTFHLYLVQKKVLDNYLGECLWRKKERKKKRHLA